MKNQNNELKNMMSNELKNIMSSFFQMHSPSGSGSLPSNTIDNPRGDLKAITTQSGVSYDGPTILTTSSPLPKEVEREPEATKDNFASTFKSLFSNKEKLFELANTPLNENFLAVLLKKLPEKLRDPDRFLILCDFYGLKSCMALADLGASMTLELATRTVAYPIGIAEDVCVRVGKFIFPADFVVVDYDVDPRVPLILGRPFLRTARALVDVYGEELILRDSDEKLIFHVDSTSKHPPKHDNKSINMINFINITCEDRFPEVLKLKKSNHPSSNSTTPLSDSLPCLTLFETSDFILEEFDDELALLDPFPPGIELKLIKSSIDDSPPLDVLGGNSVTFSNPLSDSNDDFTSSNGESLPEEDVLEENFKIYSNPLFEFDEEYISTDVNPLFNECFDPGGDIDEIDTFLDIDISLDFEDDYYNTEGNVIYLECLLTNDTTHNLPPEVFLDHDPRSLKDEPEIDDLKSMVKVFDPEIHEKIISLTSVRLPFEDRHYFPSHLLSESFFLFLPIL
ncbi:reverse transcriptase domain-containing protein [Tanacetum coccineum]